MVMKFLLPIISVASTTPPASSATSPDLSDAAAAAAAASAGAALNRAAGVVCDLRIGAELGSLGIPELTTSSYDDAIGVSSGVSPRWWAIPAAEGGAQPQVADNQGHGGLVAAGSSADGARACRVATRIRPVPKELRRLPPPAAGDTRPPMAPPCRDEIGPRRARLVGEYDYSRGVSAACASFYVPGGTARGQGWCSDAEYGLQHLCA